MFGGGIDAHVNVCFLHSGALGACNPSTFWMWRCMRRRGVLTVQVLDIGCVSFGPAVCIIQQMGCFSVVSTGLWGC